MAPVPPLIKSTGGAFELFQGRVQCLRLPARSQDKKDHHKLRDGTFKVDSISGPTSGPWSRRRIEINGLQVVSQTA